jgi:hypothetical protein
MVYLHDASSIILDTFCMALSYDLEADLSFVVVESEVHNQGYFDNDYHPTFEVMPKNLELAQQQTSQSSSAAIRCTLTTNTPSHNAQTACLDPSDLSAIGKAVFVLVSQHRSLC